jgi:inorganic pyrophosphatase
MSWYGKGLKMFSASGIAKLPPFHEKSNLVNVIIDTPKGAPYKLKYEEKTGIFRVHKALPLGFTFPFNFGFLPSTEGGDGDPLDVLMITDYVMPVGAMVLGRMISVLEAEQIENKQKQRNDRLLAIPVELLSRKPMQPMVEFNAVLKTAIVDFFVKYNELQNKTFRPLRYAPASRAIQTVRKNMHQPTT